MIGRGLWLAAALALATSANAEPVGRASSALPTVMGEVVARSAVARPVARDNRLPRARWEHRTNGELWTRVTLAAIAAHGQDLLEIVPEDIADWCPAYAENGAEDRAAFWTALLSALSRHESTWNPRAVGGGGRWFGLLQIYPPTAEFRNCGVETGEELKNAPANLNCAVKILAATVPRDQAVAVKGERWKGVAADWGPIRNDAKRSEMQRYTKSQTYCRPLSEVRPKQRP